MGRNSMRNTIIGLHVAEATKNADKTSNGSSSFRGGILPFIVIPMLFLLIVIFSVINFILKNIGYILIGLVLITVLSLFTIWIIEWVKNILNKEKEQVRENNYANSENIEQNEYIQTIYCNNEQVKFHISSDKVELLETIEENEPID